ncbi:PIR Superfamily Protein [Plasmodium ovale wallikeri]|uniref:PIR Superfamily Protein n=1 Tax=Plasmodium ovale wallikeri TaxID=864142 RepID=A0A1A9ANI0_PLAOA|nr:PIR Superfamily Protein [Plasmodium ovale wallikeri]
MSTCRHYEKHVSELLYEKQCETLGFTGLGFMARNLLRRGRINGMNSHDEFTNELLEDTYDDQAYPGITETYIGYQAT